MKRIDEEKEQVIVVVKSPDGEEHTEEVQSTKEIVVFNADWIRPNKDLPLYAENIAPAP